MPISRDFDVLPLTTDEFRKLDFEVMRHAFAAQNGLGRLAEEHIYQNDFAYRLQAHQFNVVKEARIQLQHGPFAKSLYIDAIVNRCGLYELKAVTTLTESHTSQLLSYLFLLDMPRGKLINFRSTKVTSQYVNAVLTTEQRRNFEFNSSQFRGTPSFCSMVQELLRDWGTSLSTALYSEALVSLLGGHDTVETVLPLFREKQFLGNQHFLLAEQDIAFKITALSNPPNSYAAQLENLIRGTTLSAIHWVNIQHGLVTISTVSR